MRDNVAGYVHKSDKTIKSQGCRKKKLTEYPWDDLFQLIVVRCGITPSEFWKLKPAEASLIIDAVIPQKTYGNLSQKEVDEMIEHRNRLEAQGVILA